jgi:hypothetical protein
LLPTEGLSDFEAWPRRGASPAINWKRINEIMRNDCRRIFVLTDLMAAVMLVACGGADEPNGPEPTDVGERQTTFAAADVVSATSTGMDFATRCAQSGVIKCVDFDDVGDFNTNGGVAGGAYGKNAGILPPSGTTDFSRATRDTTQKASGTSSLKFTLPANAGADASGSYFTNFSTDLSTQFGENSEFFVQWRQRFSPEYLTTKFSGGGGWKQVIIGTGDVPGKLYASCTSLETVVQNTQHRGFPQMYNSCSGSTSHGPYQPFEERFLDYDFKMQNARSAPYCLYSQSGSSYFAPVGNCFGYFANEWMTFQVRIKTGPRVNDEFSNSYVTLWVAREGQASEEVITWGPWNLTAGSPAENQRYGKIWLLPYNTNRSSSVTNPVTYTWYDDLIISRTKIVDP